MSRSRTTRYAVTALLGAALVTLGPTPAHADPTIHLTGTVSSPYAGTFDYLRVDGPDGFEFFDNGNPDGTFALDGKPGDYTVYVAQYGGGNESFGFNGQTTPVHFDSSGVLNVSIPIHTLHLRTEKPGGALAPSQTQVDCQSAHPTGWDYASSFSNGDSDGDSTLYVTSTASAAEDCELRVTPDSGPIRNVRVPGNASSFTHVVAPGVHVSGTLSDGLGHPAPAGTSVYAYNDDPLGRLSGQGLVDGAGHYDLELDPGSHVISVPNVVSSSALQYRFDTVPQNLTANTVLNLAPATDPLTVHARTAAVGGDPVPSTARLNCSGVPDGQSLIGNQYTFVDKPTASDFVMPGTAAAFGCTLELDPTVGVYSSQTVSIPDGGDEITAVLDTGIGFTGQLTVNDISTFPSAQVTVQPDGHESDTVFTANDGTFAFSGVAAGDATIVASVNDPTWGNVQWQRRVTLVGGDNVALAPNIDYLQLYLLDENGDPGTGTAQLSCSGSQAGDVNTFTGTVATRSGTDVITLPGYAADASQCQLSVTWSDSTATSKSVTLDPNSATSFTLLKNGVTFNSDPFTSNDDDGVADALEAYAPNQGDGNDDGTPDYEQADVASLPENGGALGSGEDYLTVAGPAGSELISVGTDDVVQQRSRQALDGPPDGSELPLGYLDFEVVVPPGTESDPQTVTVTVPDTSDLNGYTVFDPATGAWTDMPANQVSFTPTTIVLTVQDGSTLDRSPVAGRVRHPGGGTKVDINTPMVTGAATTQPNDKGWYGGNVTVHWSVIDNDSTVSPPADTVVSTEGGDVTALAATPSCDRRGNCATGKLEHLKIDKTKPVVNLTGPVQGATYVVGAAPARQCTGTDPGGSGVPDGGGCVVTVTGADNVGTVTVTAKATDRAGNTATKTVTYRQVYKAGGLVAPAAASKMKVFKQGSTVVVQLKLLNAAGAAVTPLKAPVWVAPKAKGKSKGKVNQPVSTVKADKGSVLVKRGSVWEYRWGTSKAKKGKAYVITVQLDDGTTRTVTVGIG